jgi:hypothetical protein
MDVYIVTMQGVYRHNIMGVYRQLDNAKVAAIVAIKAEEDNYHRFDVRKFEVDVATNGDGKLVFRVKRQQDLRETCRYVLVCKDEKSLVNADIDWFTWEGVEP